MLSVMRLTRLAAAALLLAAAACAPNPKDRYAPPPNDGSVSANSADVVDNPSMPNNAPKQPK